MTQDSRAALRYWPGPSDTNNYHALLYGSACSVFDIAPGNLAIAASLAGSRPVVFHLHWLNAILARATDADGAAAAADAFLADIDHFRARGGRLLWTIHNLVSHDCKWPETEIALSAALATRADAIHIHSARSLPEIAAVFPLPTDKVRVSAHGAYPDFSPAVNIPRTRARRLLRLPPNAPVLLLPGLQRRYKGAAALRDALRLVWADHPDLYLVIAGPRLDKPFPHPLAPDEIARIRGISRFLPPDDLARVARAADAAILPYTRVLTSGSLLMALGLGLPCIAPDVGQITESLGTPPAGWTYPANGGVPALTAAIRAFLADRAAGRLPALAAAARDRAIAQPWPDFTPVIRAALG